MWSGPITVCFWLKEKKQQTEQHPCYHGEPLLLCPSVSSISPHPYVSCSPDGAVISVLARMCHLALPVKPWGVWVGVILPVL